MPLENRWGTDQSMRANTDFVEVIDEQVTIRDEKHYRLVPPDELTAEELAQYRREEP